MMKNGGESASGSSLAFGVSSSLPSCQTCGCAERSCEECRTPGDCSNCASCCCSTVHQSWRHARIGNGIRVEYLSSAWMLDVVCGLIGFGVIAGSFVLLAFVGDSLVDLSSGFAVLAGFANDSSVSN